MTAHSLLYGYPPRELAEMPAGAQQCSPLVPGGAALEMFPEASASSALVYAPPGSVERRYVLAHALRALAVGAPLIALAPKDKGGSRLAREIEAFGCTVAQDARKHHRIIRTTRPAQLVGIAEAFAEGGQQVHSAHGLFTQPGIFSWDRIDEGSVLLLSHLPALRGTVADFGCGYGLLSRAILTSPSVTHLTAIDIDHRAIATAQKNIADARATFVWTDVRHSTALPRALDAVVMNPPFHDAGVEDKSLGQHFIAAAAASLKPGGQCWLVANRHLPYEAMLASAFGKSRCVAEGNGFKVINAEKA